MKAVLLLLLSLAAFAALSLSMDRHAREVLGATPSPGRRQAWRVTGWCLLALALLLGVAGWGRGVGVVEWTAALSAVSVPWVMLVLPRLADRRRGAARRVAAPLPPFDGAAPAGLAGRLWRGLRLGAVLGMPVFMLWAFLRA